MASECKITPQTHPTTVSEISKELRENGIISGQKDCTEISQFKNGIHCWMNDGFSFRSFSILKEHKKLIGRSGIGLNGNYKGMHPLSNNAVDILRKKIATACEDQKMKPLKAAPLSEVGINRNQETIIFPKIRLRKGESQKQFKERKIRTLLKHVKQNFTKQKIERLIGDLQNFLTNSSPTDPGYHEFSDQEIKQLIGELQKLL